MKSDKISGLRNSFLKKDFEFGRSYHPDSKSLNYLTP